MFDAIVRNGILTSVAALIVSVIGIAAAMRVPVQMIPDLDVRTISVDTRWPGATPQDVEKEILIEQEQYLRTLPNLSRLEATASSGRSSIELDFPFGVDMTQTLIAVNNALNQVPSYPENVDEPQVTASSFSANSFMYFSITPIPGNPRGLDMDMMRDFLIDNVRTRLSNVPGVSNVNIFGGAEKQIKILINAESLADRELSILDVRNAIRERNRDVSGGEIDSGKRRYLLRTIGRFDSVDDLKGLIIARRGDAVIRLGDVAEVELDHFEIRNVAYLDDNPAISLSVYREPGSNVIAIKYAMLEAIERVRIEVLEPAGMTIRLTSEDAGYVEASIANVWTNLGLGAIFAITVMFVFLRSLKATAVGIIGVPICTIAAFIGLLAAGRTINVISLAGIAFAIGMTLDNSIVVIEAIETKRREGLDRFRAAVEGVRSVWSAVLASTLTTILVFVPVLFIVEEAGQLYSDVAIAISASIFASMLVAITLIPTASARLSFGTEVRASGHPAKEHVLAGVDRLLRSPRRRLLTIGSTVVASIAIIIVLTPRAEYLPEGEEPKIFASMNAPPGYNLETMSAIGDQVRAHFLPHIKASPEQYERGGTNVPPISYLSSRVDASRIFVLSQPVYDKDTDALVNALTEHFRQYPGMRAFAARGSIISSNDGGTRSINLDISGPTLEMIYAAATTAIRRAEDVFDNPRVSSSPSSLALTQPLIEIRPNWSRAAELGLSATQLGYAVAALTDGAFVDEFFQGDDKIDIFLFGSAGSSARLDGVSDLPIFTPGGVVPLRSVAGIQETVDTNAIRRINGQRTVTLNIIPPSSVPLEEGVEIVQQDVVQYLRSSGDLPGDIGVEISGASDQLDATKQALAENYPVALVLIYLLLVAIFRHWGFPLLILTTIPLGIAGGIVGLAILNLVGAALGAMGLGGFSQPFDMISMLGFLILMGTVVNNPILIVDRAVRNFEENSVSALDAVREAIAVRIRPIAMSTLTTIVGLSPLVFIPGAGTELYRGVGAIVLFGILGAAIVSLTMLPALTVSVLSRIERQGDTARKNTVALT